MKLQANVMSRLLKNCIRIELGWGGSDSLVQRLGFRVDDVWLAARMYIWGRGAQPGQQSPARHDSTHLPGDWGTGSL